MIDKAGNTYSKMRKQGAANQLIVPFSSDIPKIVAEINAKVIESTAPNTFENTDIQIAFQQDAY